MLSQPSQPAATPYHRAEDGGHPGHLGLASWQSLVGSILVHALLRTQALRTEPLRLVVGPLLMILLYHLFITRRTASYQPQPTS